MFFFIRTEFTYQSFLPKKIGTEFTIVLNFRVFVIQNHRIISI